MKTITQTINQIITLTQEAEKGNYDSSVAAVCLKVSRILRAQNLDIHALRDCWRALVNEFDFDSSDNRAMNKVMIILWDIRDQELYHIDADGNHGWVSTRTREEGYIVSLAGAICWKPSSQIDDEEWVSEVVIDSPPPQNQTKIPNKTYDGYFYIPSSDKEQKAKMRAYELAHGI